MKNALIVTSVDGFLVREIQLYVKIIASYVKLRFFANFVLILGGRWFRTPRACYGALNLHSKLPNLIIRRSSLVSLAERRHELVRFLTGLLATLFPSRPSMRVLSNTPTVDYSVAPSKADAASTCFSVVT